MHFDYIIVHYINEDQTEPMVPDCLASRQRAVPETPSASPPFLSAPDRSVQTLTRHSDCRLRREDLFHSTKLCKFYCKQCDIPFCATRASFLKNTAVINLSKYLKTMTVREK